MKAEIITIGDEILIGQVVNTNAAWLGERLSLAGIGVVRMTTLRDAAGHIEEGLHQAFSRADIVITTGGLGPTHDDITKDVVATFFGKTLKPHPPTLARIESYFSRRKRTVPEASRRMGMVPDGFEVLTNSMGTAPGLWYNDVASSQTRHLVVLPGVPREMKALMREAVLPRLQQLPGRKNILHKTLLTAGIGESLLAAKLGDLSAWLSEEIQLAYLPSTQGVRLRLSGRGAAVEVLQERLSALEQHIRSRIESHIYGEGTDTLEAVLGQLFRAQGLTVGTAESCTGGLIAHRLTNVSGSSAYMIGSIIAYANEIKTNALGVAAEAIREHGAVSEVVVKQMADGLRKRFNTDIGLATSGIMGPTGGSLEKPVGTVWLGYADAHGVEARRLRLVTDRHINKELASTAALSFLRLQVVRRLV